MPSDGARVSVVIPAYNAAAFLDSTLASVLSQTRTPDEIVVVDDGSTDATLAVVEQYAKELPDLIRVVSQENLGPAAARNAGIRAASGPLVAILDHDDAWRPEKLEQQLRLFDDPKVEFTATGYTYSVNGGPPVPTLIFGWEDQAPAVLHRLLLSNVILTSTVVATRALLTRVGMFDERIWWGDEYDLWLRIGASGARMAYLPQALTEYSRGAKNLSTRFYNEGLDPYVAAMEARFQAEDLPPSIQRRRRWYMAHRHMNNACRYLADGHPEAALASILRAFVERPLSARAGWIVIAARAIRGCMARRRG